MILTPDDDKLQHLRGLGLSRLQARVFLALALLKADTVGKVARCAEVNRAESYRILRELQDLGLAQVSLDRPRIYRLADPIVALSDLVEEQRRQLRELEAKRDYLCSWLSRLPARERRPEVVRDRLRIIKGPRRMRTEVLKLWNDARHEILAIMCGEAVGRRIAEGFGVAAADAARRGVRVKIITDICSDNLEEWQVLLRYCDTHHSDEARIEIDIADRSRILFRFGPPQESVSNARNPPSKLDVMLLASEDPAFVGTMRAVLGKFWVGCTDSDSTSVAVRGLLPAGGNASAQTSRDSHVVLRKTRTQP